MLDDVAPTPLPITPDGEQSCPPLVGTVLPAAEAEELAVGFKALADPARLRLLSLVGAHEGGEACVCELTGPVGLSQPTVSHHLRVLVEAGFLTREKRGVWAYYRLVPDRLDQLVAALPQQAVTAPAR